MMVMCNDIIVEHDEIRPRLLSAPLDMDYDNKTIESHPSELNHL